MDSFGLNNILGALGLSKKLNSVQKADKRAIPVNNSQNSTDSSDSISISEESFTKAVAQTVAQQIQDENQTVDKVKIAQIKEQIKANTYKVPAQEITERLLNEPVDIYQRLK